MGPIGSASNSVPCQKVQELYAGEIGQAIRTPPASHTRLPGETVKWDQLALQSERSYTVRASVVFGYRPIEKQNPRAADRPAGFRNRGDVVTSSSRQGGGRSSVSGRRTRPSRPEELRWRCSRCTPPTSDPFASSRRNRSGRGEQASVAHRRLHSRGRRTVTSAACSLAASATPRAPRWSDGWDNSPSCSSHSMTSDGCCSASTSFVSLPDKLVSHCFDQRVQVWPVNVPHELS